jgi:2-haloacid dehalogenase
MTTVVAFDVNETLLDLRALDPALSEVRLVAAHSWDITRALAAGCRAAFVARPGMVLRPIGAQPDIVGPDIAAVVDQTVTVDA